MTVCQKLGSISNEYKLPPKNTIGVMTIVGIIDICSKFLLKSPIKNPNNAKVKATKIYRRIISKGNFTFTSAKKSEVQKITAATIKVLVAPAPT